MFYPEAMTEVEFIITAKDLMAVTDALAGQGIFQQADASYLSVESGVGSADDWQQKVTAYGALERRILTSMQILNVDEGQPPPAERISLTNLDVIQPQVEQGTTVGSQQPSVLTEDGNSLVHGADEFRAVVELDADIRVEAGGEHLVFDLLH